MRKLLLATTAIAGLILAPAVWAQEHGGGASGAGQAAPGAQPNKSESAQPSKSESAPAGGAQTKPQAEQPKAGEQGGKANKQEMREERSNKPANQQMRDEKGEKGGKATKGEMREERGNKTTNEQMREERGEHGGKATKGEMREERGNKTTNEQMREERGEKGGKATTKGMEQERGQGGAATTREMQQEGGKSTTTGPSGRGSSFNLSSEQKTKVVTDIRGANVREARDINVSNVRVGVSVPRNVTEYWEAVPSNIVTIVPEWRAYKIVRIHNEYLIIDPETFEIVYILS